MLFLEHFITLFLESAPWLLFGFVLAGLLKMFVPMQWMNKQLGGHGLKPTIKAAIFGAPLPLCSCGVIPAAIGLRRAGASKAATTSFLVSTPETGVDSISVSYVLLGPFMAIIRPIAAIVSAIFAGLLVGRDDKDETNKAPQPQAASTQASSCCSSTPSTASSCCESSNTQASSCCSSSSAPETSCCESSSAQASSCCSSTPAPEASCCESSSAQASSCCGSTPAPETSCCESSSTQASSCSNNTQSNTGVFNKLSAGLRYAATELLDDTAVWLLVGLSFAAVIQTFIPDGFLASWGNGLLAMLVMVVISIPMYICATASTPIAAGLLLAGVAPGPVLVFMLAGPATNIATLGVVTKELGKKALFGYLTGVLGGALLFGFLVDFLVTKFDLSVVPQIGPELELLPHWISLSAGIILALLMVLSITKQITMKLVHR